MDWQGSKGLVSSSTKILRAFRTMGVFEKGGLRRGNLVWSWELERERTKRWFYSRLWNKGHRFASSAHVMQRGWHGQTRNCGPSFRDAMCTHYIPRATPALHCNLGSSSTQRTLQYATRACSLIGAGPVRLVHVIVWTHLTIVITPWRTTPLLGF